MIQIRIFIAIKGNKKTVNWENLVRQMKLKPKLEGGVIFDHTEK